MNNASEYPLAKVCKAWFTKLKDAYHYKKKKFQDDADEAMLFFHGGQELNELMWGARAAEARGHFNRDASEDREALPSATFRAQLNKVSELVQLFGPSMYAHNPSIVVEPKSLDLPLDMLISTIPPEVMQQYQQQSQMQQQQAQQMGMPPPPPFDPGQLFPPDPKDNTNKIVALLLQYYLDYIQRENDKKTHIRRMVDEALIKGMGIVVTEPFTPFPDAPSQIRSRYESVDNLLIDPDTEVIDDAEWCAIKSMIPYWELEDRWGYNRGDLKKAAKGESLSQTAETDASGYGDYWRKNGKTNDLVTVWELYSKMGVGDRLSKVGEDNKFTGESLIPKEYRSIVKDWGDFVYLVLVDGIPHPINCKNEDLLDLATMPDSKTEEGKAANEQKHDDLFEQVQWPIPFWSDGGWPFTQLAFHEVPNCLWPMSHIKPGMGQLKFINYCFSFLANKVRQACKTVVGIPKSANEELKEKLLSGQDYQILEIETSLMQTMKISDLVSFIQMPDFKGDIYMVLEKVMESFDKATGLTELLYAAQGGMRSAQEANLKQQQISIRPDDMASKVEDTASLIARKEAMAARWILDAEGVAPILGQRGAGLWQQYVMTGEIEAVSREFHYRVEAGSARKPNKDAQVANAQQLMQVIMPFYESYAMQTGNVAPFNQVLRLWLVANDVEPDPAFFLSPPPPPQPSPDTQAKMQLEQQKLQMQGQNEQGKAQLEMQGKQQDMQLAQQRAGLEMQLEQQKLAAEQQKTQMDMQAEQTKQQMEMRGLQQTLVMEAQKQRMQLGAEREQMSLKRQEGQQSLEMQQAMGALKLKLQKDAAQVAATKPKGKE